MKRLFFCLALFATLLFVGCAGLDDASTDTRSVQQKIVTVDGDDFIVEIEYDTEQMTDNEALDLLETVTVAHSGLDKTNTFEGLTIQPADPGWATVPVPFAIMVEPEVDRVQNLDELRWYWTELDVLSQWCPPGH